MKMIVNNKFFGGGKYNAPEIEMFESVVERGFEASGEYSWGEDGATGSVGYEPTENDADI